MRTTSFSCTVSMEHIHPDLIDVPVNVELQEYKGSTSGFSSDDPSEIDVISVEISDEQLFKDIAILQAKKNGLELEDKIITEIIEKYGRE